MATQVFLLDTAATSHRGTNTAGLNTTTSGWLPKATGTARGSGVVSKATNTVAGATNGVEVTNGAAATRLEWITPPVDADVTIAGTITGNIWALESANAANTAINFYVERIAAATGTLTRIATSAFTTELTTGNLARAPTATPTSTAVNKGDRLRICIFGDDAGTMASGQTFTTAYNGTTGAASGDTYLSFTETFGFQTTDPTTTTLYLTDTASDVATADVDREAWTSRGGSALTDVTNTAAGWTDPVQVTDTVPTSATSFTPADDVTISVGFNTTIFMQAQSFQIGSTQTITAVDLKLFKLGAPADNVILSLQADASGAPSGTALTSVTVAGSSLGTTTPAATRYVFDAGVSLTGSTTYWLVLERSGSVDASNNYRFRSLVAGGYASGESKQRNSAGTWSAQPGDAYFTVYSGGQAVSWFTKPLSAFTLSGLVKVNRRVLASAATANASVGVEIARVNEDGTSAAVWGYANRDAAITSGSAGEIATTETAYTCYVAGDDLAFTDGQRIRIRLFHDDCADVPLVTAHTLTSYYGGPTGGASGDTYLILGQTLTEFSAGTTVSVTTPGAITLAGSTGITLRRSANNTFEGGTNTVAITAGNSGGASGDAFTGGPRTVGSGTAPVYSSTHPAIGTMGGKFETTGASQTSEMVWTPGGGANDVYTIAARAYVYLTTALNTSILTALDDTTELGWVRVNTSGFIALSNNDAVGDVSVPLNEWVRIEFTATQNTPASSTVTLFARLYLDPNAAVGAYDDEITVSYATNTKDIRSLTVGMGWSSGGPNVLYLDNVGYATTGVWMGPLGTVVAPKIPMVAMARRRYT